MIPFETAQPSESAPPATIPFETPDITSSPDPTATTQSMLFEKRLYVHIGERTLSVIAENNDTAEAFLRLLVYGAISIKLEESGQFKKSGILGYALPFADEMITAEPGDIVLYHGNQIAISYTENNRELSRIGRIEGISDEELQRILGDSQIKVRFSLYENSDERTVLDDWIHDIPENEGQWNVIKRARQATQLQYTPVQKIRLTNERTIKKGSKVQGILYSSVRDEALYVPQCVSIESFMTALQNPNSYLYTRRSVTPNGIAYYGAVCSSFAAWCYGIDDVIPTTISFSSYPGFTRLPQKQQNVQSLQLGDMLNVGGHHVVVITDIIRNYEGRIISVEVSEGRLSSCKATVYAADRIETKYFENGYEAYRYDLIEQVPYTENPWIHLNGETGDPNDHLALIPRRGNQANWRSTESVEIDIIDFEDYSEYLLYDETGTLIMTDTIPENHLLSFDHLPRGKYSVALTNGEESSDAVDFIVMDVNPVFTAMDGGLVRVDYPENEGDAASISFVSTDQNSRRYMSVYAFHVLTEEEKE